MPTDEPPQNIFENSKSTSITSLAQLLSFVNATILAPSRITTRLVIRQNKVYWHWPMLKYETSKLWFARFAGVCNPGVTNQHIATLAGSATHTHLCHAYWGAFFLGIWFAHRQLKMRSHYHGWESATWAMRMWSPMYSSIIITVLLNLASQEK